VATQQYSKTPSDTSVADVARLQIQADAGRSTESGMAASGKLVGL
jgi:hypothetical protein